jgi:hypothetical protein
MAFSSKSRSIFQGKPHREVMPHVTIPSMLSEIAAVFAKAYWERSKQEAVSYQRSARVWLRAER